jgi:chromosome segregation ATPase
VHDKGAQPSREERKQADADRRRRQRERESLQKRIADLEGRIAAREAEVKQIEAEMSTPGFYERPDASKPVIDRHQALMWEVGDLMAQWESLQEHASEHAPES